MAKKSIAEKPTAMGLDATVKQSDRDLRRNSSLRIEFNLMSLYSEENAAKSRERQLNLRKFQAIAPKKSQTLQSSLKTSIDDDPDWDPFGYEEDLMLNLPDPIRLKQLNQYYQSYEYYQSQFPFEDGQFDDVVSDM